MNKFIVLLIPLIIIGCSNEINHPYTHLRVEPKKFGKNQYTMISKKTMSDYTFYEWGDDSILDRFWILKNNRGQIVYKGQDNEEIERIWNHYLIIRDNGFGQRFIDQVSIYDMNKKTFCIKSNDSIDFVLPLQEYDLNSEFPIIYKVKNIEEVGGNSDISIFHVNLIKYNFTGNDVPPINTNIIQVFETAMN
jgi:hypothetical protein